MALEDFIRSSTKGSYCHDSTFDSTLAVYSVQATVYVIQITGHSMQTTWTPKRM